MSSIPVSGKTFTRGFLGGSGSLEVTPSPAAATAFLPGKAFPDGTRDLVVASAGVGLPSLQFGSGASFECTSSLSANAGLTLRLFQPGDAEPIQTSAPATQVPNDKIGALLQVQAEAKVAGAVPIGGPAGFSFGLSASAGGRVQLARYRVYDRAKPAGPLLLDLLSDLRLPHDRGTPETLPEFDEIVQFSYGGFLELGAALNWGYSLTGAEGIALRDLGASVEYAFKARAALTLNYRLAGDFAMTVRRGSSPGFVRLIVQKTRERRTQFAAAFDLEADYELVDLPETPDEFLATFLGTDLTTAIGAFEGAMAARDPAALGESVGKLMSGVVRNLSGQWVDSALDAGSLQRFLGELQKAVAAYRSIDGRVLSAVTALYEKATASDGSGIERALTAIAGMTGPEDLAKLQDPSVWQIAQQLSGGDLFAAAFGKADGPFAAVQETAEKTLELLHSPGFQRLRDFIGAVQRELPPRALIDRLGQVTTPEALAHLADTTLQGLLERVLGRAFESLRAADVPEAFKDLRDTLDKLNEFRDRFQHAIRQALDQSVSLQVNAVYTRATGDRGLLDVEIDIRAQEGRALFQQAVSGRLRALLAAARGGALVRVRDAVLTHDLTGASHLQINVLGWRYKRLVEVVAASEHSLQVHDGGLIQVFTTTASIKEATETKTERLESNFVLRMAGESAGPLSDDATRRFVVRTLDRMSVRYDILQTDEVTDPEELSGYLALGEQLKLVPAGLLGELRQQFPHGFGKVEARYVVRFDDQAVRDAFIALPADRVVAVARTTARRLVSSCFVQSRHRAFLAGVGLAYADPGIASIYYDRGGLLQLAQSEMKIMLPASVTGGAPAVDRIGPATRDRRNDVLGRLFANEDVLSSRLAALARAIEDARLGRKAVTVQDLEDVGRALAAAADDTNELGGPNAFFAVIDALVADGAGSGRRESALVLDITPPGGQKVTKVFMQAAA